MDSDNRGVAEALQKELNREFACNLDPSLFSLEECIKQGEKYKHSKSPAIALKFFEEAVRKADENAMKELFPRITSCYREKGQPQKAVDIFDYVSSKFGNKMISSALLTSVAAAYCDIEDYTLAKKFCDRACAMLGGKCDENLAHVYMRIKKAVQ